MAREFTFTDPGEGIHEAEIVEISVSVGDTVEEGDTVLIVETDKATTDLPSPYSGEIEDIPISEGDMVEVGDVLLRFSDDGEGAEEDEQPEEADTDDTDESDAHEAQAGDTDATEEQETAATQDQEDVGGKAAAVGELPSEDPATRRTEDDADTTAADRDAEPAHKPRRDEGPVPASPATRRLARELDVELTDVEPSGPHDRVTPDDVRAAADHQAAEPPTGGKPREQEAPEERGADEQAPEAQQRPTVATPPLPDFEQFGRVERVKMRGVRRITAERVTVSWREIPHVTHHDVVDVTALERWRREHRGDVEDAGGDLTLMVLVGKAIAGLLPRHPRFNASLDLDAQEIVLKHHCHLGFAVDTDDGLIVPVLRDVDRRSMMEVAVELSGLIERVRARDVSNEDLQGGTFTITNVGPLGGAGFTPLIRHPEVAILGMGQARLESVVTGDLDDHRTEVRFRLPLSLAYDHRVADGADAARFVTELGEALADPDRLLLTL